MKVVDALRAALEDVQGQVSRLEARLQELREVEKGLQYAVAHPDVIQARPKSGPSPVPGNHGDWPSLSRPKAVLRVLSEADRPLSPQEVVEELTAHGRTDPRPGVSSALTRLKADGKVEAVGFSQWIATKGDAVHDQESASESHERPDEPIHLAVRSNVGAG
jgi:hypothetical protein